MHKTTHKRIKKKLTELEFIRFLIERAHDEAKLFWHRNNFMFLTNTAMLGYAFYYFFLDPPTNISEGEAKIVISVSGIFVSLIWLGFNKIGRRMNHVYVQDAKNIVMKNDELNKIFANSLDAKTPSESVEKRRKLKIFRGNYWSATMLNYVFIMGFILAWLYILFTPIQ